MNKLPLLICLLFFSGFIKIYAQKDSLFMDSFEFNAQQKYHSPKKAALLSTFIPGAGQIYNNQAWKTPIVYVVAGGVVYFAITNNTNRAKFKKEYYNRVNNNTVELLPDYTNYTDEGIYNLYNAYKSNFQLSLIIGGLFYAAQILDAYVYGHLFSFNINDDISMRIIPKFIPQSLTFTRQNPNIGLCLNFTF